MSTWAIVVNSAGLIALAIVILRLRRMETRMSALGSPAKPFWANVQTKLVKDLTHPNAQFEEMDDLMAALEELTIDEPGRVRLHELLVERTTSEDPEVSDAERRKAKLLILAMEEVLGEAKETGVLKDIQMVGVKDTEPKDE